MKNTKKKILIKEYLFVIFGTALLAFGLYVFHFPQNLTIGGVAGYALIISNFIKLPISVISLIINAVLLCLGFIILGKEFGGKTICSNLTFSATIWILEQTIIINEPVTSDMFVNLICGTGIAAFGVAMIFNQNASSGGTDILASILKKYCRLDMGIGLLIANIIVVIASYFTYDLQTAIYNGLGCIINSICVNIFLDGWNVKKEMVIISNKPDKIKKLVLEKMDRGLTVYKAEGGYTEQERKIMVTILSQRDYIKIKKLIKEVDPDVFVITRRANEVLGKGFDNI